MNVKNLFAHDMKGLLKDILLPPIIEYYKSKGVESSVEEILSYLEIPMTPISAPITPNSGRGGTKRRIRRPKAEIPDEMRCTYILTKGDLAGERCENKRENAPGALFCGPCKKKRTAIVRQASLKGENPKHSSPQGKRRNTLVSVGGGYQIDTRHNFYIRIGTKPGEYVCLGVYDPEDSSTRALTPEEEEICASLGYSIIKEN